MGWGGLLAGPIKKEAEGQVKAVLEGNSKPGPFQIKGSGTRRSMRHRMVV